MRLIILMGFGFISGCALIGERHQHEHEHDHQAAAAPVARIINPDDGEKLLLHGGRYMLLKVTEEGTGAKQLFMGTEILPSGTAIPVHAHDGYEEIIFIHQGNAEIKLGDESVLVEPGTTIHIPAGAWHGVAAHGAGEVNMLAIFPQVEIADFFRRIGFKEGDPPPVLTAEDWGEIMQQHQMRARR